MQAPNLSLSDTSILRRRVDCLLYISSLCGSELRALHDMQRHIRRAMCSMRNAARSANAATAAATTHRTYGPTKARTDWNTDRAEKMNVYERLHR